QAGMQAYGGQFGCFLPVIYGTRDILSFVDAQDYNTPPLEGLDGNYYFPGNADYHVAMSEMLVHGFPIGGNPKDFFPPLPPEKVAIGLPATPTSARNYTEIPAIEDALRYLIEAKPFAGAEYRLRRSSGIRHFSERCSGPLMKTGGTIIKCRTQSGRSCTIFRGNEATVLQGSRGTINRDKSCATRTQATSQPLIVQTQ